VQSISAYVPDSRAELEKIHKVCIHTMLRTCAQVKLVISFRFNINDAIKQFFIFFKIKHTIAINNGSQMNDGSSLRRKNFKTQRGSSHVNLIQETGLWRDEGKVVPVLN
jgi:hypothetical protein